jgi:HD-GYP domain-containing protein (c-di-GMP phosphodiesterase class II)
MINKIRKVILLITTILFACHLQVAGKELFVSKQNIPDFKFIFDKLSQNRITYNRYNDSIFSIHNHDEWIRFFMTRSQKNHKIYNENEKLLNSIADYFETDMTDTTKENILPDAAYDSLNVHFFRNYAYALTDPFITNRVTDILIRNFKNRQDQNYYCLRAMSWKGASYYQIWKLNRDNETLKKAYDCIAYVADSAHCHTPEELGLYGYALQNLCLSEWTLHHIQPLKKLQERYEKLEVLARNHTADQLEVPETRRQLWINRIKDRDLEIVRGIYLTNPELIEKKEGDDLVKRVIKQYPDTVGLSISSKLNLIVMKLRIGEIQTRTALKEAREIYEKSIKPLTRQKVLGVGAFNSLMNHYTNLAFIVDTARVSAKYKKECVRMFCEDIIRMFRHRKDQQNSTQYNQTLEHVSTYPRLIKYLSDEERIGFVMELNVATQVTTYAHSTHVARLAEAMMKAIIKHRRELLVGKLGISSKWQVRLHQRQLITFITHAALCHDIGKNSIVSVVNNDYRQLTDEERRIIRMHPRLGLKYLKISKELKSYHDTTLGHHKWYNGKGGYPSYFDNTKSPYRFMIDIITLCDCMQAATERVGRNYKQEKSFEKVMEELREGAGTRYNPDLVKLIDDIPELYKELERIAIYGWPDIYYEIYKNYMR